MTRRSHIARVHGLRSNAGAETIATALPRPLRLAAFGLVALVVIGAAAALIASRVVGPAPPGAGELAVRASMGGFDPGSLVVRPGETVRIQLTSLDTPFHSDGGGWHQFAIDDLGVDWRVGPQDSKVFELTAPTTAGTYTWYCDICCGGRENPSMRGTLTVEG